MKETGELVTHVLPSDMWKRTRDHIVAKIKRNLCVQETNPGPEYRLRYDYILTAAEVAVVVEQVMRQTERIVVHYMELENTKKKAAS
jgi:hypothetical protein